MGHHNYTSVFINISIKFWKPVGIWKLIRHPSWDIKFLHQLTVQGFMSPHPRPPVAYNCCVSVFQACIARIEPTTLQLIDETCTSRFSSTSATGWQKNNGWQKNCPTLYFIQPNHNKKFIWLSEMAHIYAARRWDGPPHFHFIWSSQIEKTYVFQNVTGAVPRRRNQTVHYNVIKSVYYWFRSISLVFNGLEYLEVYPFVYCIVRNEYWH